ncbi:XRE family transcriptional regulator [Paraburkholderia lacunae]|uniref:Transcriptional regulator n=1 Tax=Paraburkholderia lacunae TaxID=2211104 RepID=A0A370NEB5_9BURK|nr:XRE family transcriptional regulator [Paraburkholderia lacunae]RDK03949.1 transcriptional regulator [Paraburkholderia lacunae]
MPTSKEKAAFAKRLKDSLPKDIKGGTDLARKFNLLYSGGPAVSPQTAHKWLAGTTIPKSDKLQVLAAWLQKDVHWLHYGPPPVGKAKPLARGEKYPLSPEMIELASRLAGLPPRQRNLVEEMITELYGGADDQIDGEP